MRKIIEAIVFKSNYNIDKITIIETDKMFKVVSTNERGSQHTVQYKKVETFKQFSYHEARNITDIITHMRDYNGYKVFLKDEDGYAETLLQYDAILESYIKKENMVNIVKDMTNLTNNQYKVYYDPRNRIDELLRRHPTTLEKLAELKPLFDKMKSAIDDVYKAIEEIETGVKK